MAGNAERRGYAHALAAARRAGDTATTCPRRCPPNGSRGYGSRLLDWLKAQGRGSRCNELQLISRVVPEKAHRFYLREGLAIECFQFRVRLRA